MNNRYILGMGRHASREHTLRPGMVFLPHLASWHTLATGRWYIGISSLDMELYEYYFHLLDLRPELHVHPVSQ